MDPAHALWIGGPQGSGKSSIAAALADRFGLRLYDIDAHTGVHEARMPPSENPEPQTLRSFVTHSRHRMRLVLEDLRALPDGPACIVEGQELFPTSVSAVLRFPDQALFLMPGQVAVGDVPIAQAIEREARDLRLPMLEVDRPLDEMIELAAKQFAPAVERLARRF